MESKPFLFYAFDLNPELIMKQKRKLKELCYIQEMNSLFCYNKPQNPKKNWDSQKVFINNSIYPSLREVTKQVGESRTTIVRKLKDCKNLDYQRLEKVSYKNYYKKRSMPCKIDNIDYLSLSHAVKKLKQSPNTIKKKVSIF